MDVILTRRLRRAEIALGHAKLAIDEVRDANLPPGAVVDQADFLPRLVEAVDALLFAFREPCGECGVRHPIGVGHDEYVKGLNLANAVFGNAAASADTAIKDTMPSIETLARNASEVNAIDAFGADWAARDLVDFHQTGGMTDDLNLGDEVAGRIIGVTEDGDPVRDVVDLRGRVHEGVMADGTRKPLVAADPGPAESTGGFGHYHLGTETHARVDALHGMVTSLLRLIGDEAALLQNGLSPLFGPPTETVHLIQDAAGALASAIATLADEVDREVDDGRRRNAALSEAE